MTFQLMLKKTETDLLHVCRLQESGTEYSVVENRGSELFLPHISDTGGIRQNLKLEAAVLLCGMDNRTVEFEPGRKMDVETPIEGDDH